MEISSDMGATVWKVLVRPGDSVDVGQELLILESMKMEIPVVSPCAGRVHSIYVSESDAVEEGQVMLSLDGTDSSA